MKLREQSFWPSEMVGPQASVMMTLSAFASIDAAQVDDLFATELLETAILTDLGQGLQQSKTNWTPVWAGISTHDGANMAYIAQNQAALNQYAVVIRGTDFAMLLDVWEDNQVQTTQEFTVGNTSVHIAEGTAAAHDLVVKAKGSNGNTILQELASKVGADGQGSTIFVTGHSLGGALATTVALSLQNALPMATVQVYTFAAPSAGLGDFAALFDRTFPASSPSVNSSWRIYNAWDVVPQAWQHDTLQAILDWYPSPGPAQSADDQKNVQGIVNKPGNLPYQQPSVNPGRLNDVDWAQALKNPQADFMGEVGFQHDCNTYLQLMDAPTVSMLGSLQPNKMLPGTFWTLDLTGLGFTPDTRVSFSSDDIVVHNVKFESPGELKVDVFVQQNAALGPRDVMVSSPAGVRIPGGTSAFYVTKHL